MDKLIHIMFDFGYALIFGILGLTTLYLHIPKEAGMEYYKKARKTLGIALILMTVYCTARLMTPDFPSLYCEFWIMVTVTLIFSWLTYSSILFLIETPRYLRRSFFIDGIAPTILLLGCGGAGFFFPSIQNAAMIIFGCIFGVKCIWMFHTCMKEYNLCEKELDNFYDESPDIKWIKKFIYISLAMSVLTIVTLYVPQIGIIYIGVPIAYSYMVLNIINFMPKKIEKVRARNDMLDIKPAEDEKTIKVKDLAEKIGPRLEEWVREKKFCKANLTIKDVAMEIGTNHNYLSAYLNKHLDITFQVWLNTLRIEESKILLMSEEKLSIEEIGIRVGIPQNYNFSRWFKVVTDTTPYQYRKQSVR